MLIMTEIDVSPDLASTYRALKTIDAHTEGEALRIITFGCPEIKGETI
ncbi:hypothetical protein AB4238_20425 [Shewanella sp. 10N.286.45.A1]